MHALECVLVAHLEDDLLLAVLYYLDCLRIKLCEDLWKSPPLSSDLVEISGGSP